MQYKCLNILRLPLVLQFFIHMCYLAWPDHTPRELSALSYALMMYVGYMATFSCGVSLFYSSILGSSILIFSYFIYLAEYVMNIKIYHGPEQVSESLMYFSIVPAMLFGLSISFIGGVIGMISKRFRKQ